MKRVYSENDVAEVTVTFSNKTKEERDKVLKDFAQAAYNLCLYEHRRKLGQTNENEDNSGKI